MGYNLTRHSVMRQLPQLEQLAQARESLQFNTEHPRRLAYKLREALHAAKEHDEYAHFYTTIWPRFKLREIPHAVIAEYIGEPTVGQPLMGQPLNDAPLRKTLADPTTLLEVISSAISFDKAPELFFPSVHLHEEEKLKLYKWSHAATVNWTYIDHQDGGLTLTQLDVDPDLAWRPEA